MTNDDGMLSQEEIDALLNDDMATLASDNEEDLSSIEKDTLGEIGNISFSNAATALSTLLNQKVEITTPEITLMSTTESESEFPYPHVSVLVHYTAGLEGSNVLLIKQEDASVIADLMLGGDGTQPGETIDEIHLSAVQEAMNQMMGSAATSLSTMFEKKVDISPPHTDRVESPDQQAADQKDNEGLIVKVSFRLKIGTLVDSSIMQIVPIPFAKTLVEELLSLGKEDKASPETSSAPAPENPGSEREEPHTERERQMEEASQKQPGHKDAPRNANVQTAAFSEFEDYPNQNESRNIGLLLDVPLNVTVELGRTKRKIKDILEFGPGSVIELDKLAGEHVDVLINEKPVAKGEVVVIDENFGVRITEIINQRERLTKL